MKKLRCIYMSALCVIILASCTTPSHTVPEKKTEEKDVMVNPYAEDDPLYLGNPSDAIPDVSSAGNYLMEKAQYTLSYNDGDHIPNWVAWHLDSSDLGDQDRTDSFRTDDSLPEGFYQVKASDYQYSTYGFDRGHMCPSADRTATLEDNSATFYMTNMVPQNPDNNRNVWMNLEKYERTLVDDGYELYIYSGNIGKGGVNKNGEAVDHIAWAEESTDTPEDAGILVPAYNFKIILAIDNGEDDIGRITGDTKVVSVVVPNAPSCVDELGSYTGSSRWKNFTTSIDEIEERTGWNFLDMLDDDVEEEIERKVNAE